MPVTSSIRGISIAQPLPFLINKTPHMSYANLYVKGSFRFDNVYIKGLANGSESVSANFYIPSESASGCIARLNFPDFQYIQIQLPREYLIDSVIKEGIIPLAIYTPSSDSLVLSDIQFIEGASPVSLTSSMLEDTE